MFEVYTIKLGASKLVYAGDSRAVACMKYASVGSKNVMVCLFVKGKLDFYKWVK